MATRLAHIIGVFSQSEQETELQTHKYDQATQDELLHAQAVKDDETVQRIINATAIQGEAPDKAQFERMLQTIRPEVDVVQLRELNIRLTKEQLRESIKPDLLIINTSNAIEELDKVTNTLIKRLREWYAIYDPELEHSYKDHQAFVEAILTRTSSRAQDTMGGEIGQEDIDIMLLEAGVVDGLYKQRETLLIYLEKIMQQHTPNIKRVGGPTIAAKLLAMAGSLERLSRMPSSTIQLLGAETALFRHLRNKKARPPKHGIIFNHVLLQRAPKPLRGRVARALADKLSIAAKLDYFKGEYLGDELYAQVEAKTK